MNKVLLRTLCEQDASELAEAVLESKAELKRRFRWASDRSGAAAAAFIRRFSQGVSNGQGEVLALADARSGRLVGVAGLADTSPEEGKARISLWIRDTSRGRGFATEACGLLAVHAFRVLGLRRLYARIDPANRAARKVLKKSGFQYEGCLRQDKRLNGRWVDQECWALLKPRRKVS